MSEKYDIEDVLGQDVAKKLYRLVEARERRDLDKATAERSEGEYREIEADVWEALEDSPLRPPYKLDLGDKGVVRFHPKETTYSKIVDENALLEYLEQRAMIDDLTKPQINKKALNELVREAREQDDGMPDGVTFSPRRYVQITRQKDGA